MFLTFLRLGLTGVCAVAVEYQAIDLDVSTWSLSIVACLAQIVLLATALDWSRLGLMCCRTVAPLAASLAAVSAHSLPRSPTWLGIQLKVIVAPLALQLLARFKMLVTRATLSGCWFLASVCRAVLESV